MNKKALSERDICTKFITPALVAAGWNMDTQIREEVGFTDGRIYVLGKIYKRGKQKRADYILYYKPNIPIAIVEAKDNNHTVGAGMQQALGYADSKTLDIPFVFSSNRHLLVMATGTGKTYTAFQIIYRLWKSGMKKRILFLADRTALIDQTVRNDFRHFKEAMTVIKHKQIDTAYNIYLALYQGLSDNNADADAYKQFSPGFFDLVIVDECHRGPGACESCWGRRGYFRH